MKPIPYLQITSLPFWHGDQAIVGDLAGLTALRDAIDKAIASGSSHSVMYPSDGEGYDLWVGHHENMDEVATCYEGEEAIGSNEFGISVWELPCIKNTAVTTRS